MTEYKQKLMAGDFNCKKLNLFDGLEDQKYTFRTKAKFSYQEGSAYIIQDLKEENTYILLESIQYQ